MTTSLLISTYNWVEALNLVIKSALRQTAMPTEILIADDGSTEETRALIRSFQNTSPIPIKHIWHEDKGFRRAMILNKAIAQSDADYIIQVDGDCILNKRFVKDHITRAEKNMFLHGTRANIKEESVKTVFEKEILHFNFFSSMISNTSRTLRIPLLAKMNKRTSELPRQVRGCNLSFWKQDFVAINGYDESFEGWGYEDLDITTRMMNNGVDALKLRDIAVLYHIYHNEQPRDREDTNNKLYQSVLQDNKVRCADGIDKYLIEKAEFPTPFAD